MDKQTVKVGTPAAPAMLIIGYTAELAEGVEPYLGLENISPPGSMKKPETIAQWTATELPGKQQEARYTAQFCKLTGRVSRVVAIDPQKKEVFDTQQHPTVDPAVAFVTALMSTYPKAYSPLLGRSGAPGITAFGFNLKPLFRMLGVQCAIAGEAAPVGLWYQNDALYDPYEVLIESDRRSLVTHEALFKLAGIESGDDLTNWTPCQQPVVDARLAAELVYKFSLHPTIAEFDAIRAVEEILEADGLEEEIVSADEFPSDEPEEATEAETTEGSAEGGETPAEATGGEEVVAAALPRATRRRRTNRASSTAE